MATRAIELSMPEEFGRRLKDPANTSIFHFETYLPFSEAVKLERGNANVRPPKENPPVKQMMESVAEMPQFFHLKNRGMKLGVSFCRRKRNLVLSVTGARTARALAADTFLCQTNLAPTTSHPSGFVNRHRARRVFQLSKRSPEHLGNLGSCPSDRQPARRYPGNYGFIPHTLSADGDPCDILVANTRPIIPGAVIAVRPIGVLKMTDEGGGDEKIIAVPIPKLTQRYAHVRNYTDLPEITWRQIEHFFAHYKDLEGGKWVRFAGWGDSSEAKHLITEAIDRSKSQRAEQC